MTARGVKIVVSYNDRRSFKVAAAAVAQTAHEIIPHLRQIDTQQREVVFAHMPQKIIDLLRPQHTVVSLSTIDGCAAWISKIAY